MLGLGLMKQAVEGAEGGASPGSKRSPLKQGSGGAVEMYRGDMSAVEALMELARRVNDAVVEPTTKSDLSLSVFGVDPRPLGELAAFPGTEPWEEDRPISAAIEAVHDSHATPQISVFELERLDLNRSEPPLSLVSEEMALEALDMSAPRMVERIKGRDGEFEDREWRERVFSRLRERGGKLLVLLFWWVYVAEQLTTRSAQQLSRGVGLAGAQGADWDDALRRVALMAFGSGWNENASSAPARLVEAMADENTPLFAFCVRVSHELPTTNARSLDGVVSWLRWLFIRTVERLFAKLYDGSPSRAPGRPLYPPTLRRRIAGVVEEVLTGAGSGWTMDADNAKAAGLVERKMPHHHHHHHHKHSKGHKSHPTPPPTLTSTPNSAALLADLPRVAINGRPVSIGLLTDVLVAANPAERQWLLHPPPRLEEDPGKHLARAATVMRDEMERKKEEERAKAREEAISKGGGVAKVQEEEERERAEREAKEKEREAKKANYWKGFREKFAPSVDDGGKSVKKGRRAKMSKERLQSILHKHRGRRASTTTMAVVISAFVRDPAARWDVQLSTSDDGLRTKVEKAPLPPLVTVIARLLQQQAMLANEEREQEKGGGEGGEEVGRRGGAAMSVASRVKDAPSRVTRTYGVAVTSSLWRTGGSASFARALKHSTSTPGFRVEDRLDSDHGPLTDSLRVATMSLKRAGPVPRHRRVPVDFPPEADAGPLSGADKATQKRLQKTDAATIARAERHGVLRESEEGIGAKFLREVGVRVGYDMMARAVTPIQPTPQPPPPSRDRKDRTVGHVDRKFVRPADRKPFGKTKRVSTSSTSKSRKDLLSRERTTSTGSLADSLRSHSRGLLHSRHSKHATVSRSLETLHLPESNAILSSSLESLALPDSRSHSHSHHPTVKLSTASMPEPRAAVPADDRRLVGTIPRWRDEDEEIEVVQEDEEEETMTSTLIARGEASIPAPRPRSERQGRVVGYATKAKTIQQDPTFDDLARGPLFDDPGVSLAAEAAMQRAGQDTVGGKITETIQLVRRAWGVDVGDDLEEPRDEVLRHGGVVVDTMGVKRREEKRRERSKSRASSLGEEEGKGDHGWDIEEDEGDGDGDGDGGTFALTAIHDVEEAKTRKRSRGVSLDEGRKVDWVERVDDAKLSELEKIAAEADAGEADGHGVAKGVAGAVLARINPDLGGPESSSKVQTHAAVVLKRGKDAATRARERAAATQSELHAEIAREKKATKEMLASIGQRKSRVMGSRSAVSALADRITDQVETAVKASLERAHLSLPQRAPEPGEELARVQDAEKRRDMARSRNPLLRLLAASEEAALEEKKARDRIHDEEQGRATRYRPWLTTQGLEEEDRQYTEARERGVDPSEVVGVPKTAPFAGDEKPQHESAEVRAERRIQQERLRQLRETGALSGKAAQEAASDAADREQHSHVLRTWFREIRKDAIARERKHSLEGKDGSGEGSGDDIGVGRGLEEGGKEGGGKGEETLRSTRWKLLERPVRPTLHGMKRESGRLGQSSSAPMLGKIERRRRRLDSLGEGDEEDLSMSLRARERAKEIRTDIEARKRRDVFEDENALRRAKHSLTLAVVENRERVMNQAQTTDGASGLMGRSGPAAIDMHKSGTKKGLGSRAVDIGRRLGMGYGTILTLERAAKERRQRVALDTTVRSHQRREFAAADKKRLIARARAMGLDEESLADVLQAHHAAVQAAEEEEEEDIVVDPGADKTVSKAKLLAERTEMLLMAYAGSTTDLANPEEVLATAGGFRERLDSAVREAEQVVTFKGPRTRPDPASEVARELRTKKTLEPLDRPLARELAAARYPTRALLHSDVQRAQLTKLLRARGKLAGSSASAEAVRVDGLASPVRSRPHRGTLGWTEQTSCAALPEPESKPEAASIAVLPESVEARARRLLQLVVEEDGAGW